MKSKYEADPLALVYFEEYCMKELVLIIALASGGLTLLGIYAALEYSLGVTKSEVERALAIVTAVEHDGASPDLTYWVNVYYLRLIANFSFFLKLSVGVFFISLTVLFIF